MACPPGPGPSRWAPTTRDNRIDLLVGSVGVEVKVAGSLEALTRQIQRYAHAPEISELVVVTDRAALRAVPSTVAGVPVELVYLSALA